MVINTLRFGQIEVDDLDVIRFEKGIYGFRDENSFILLHNEEYKPFMWLQSTSTPELAFIVLDPWVVEDQYALELGPDLKERLQITQEEQVLTIAIVTIPENQNEMTINLKAPILINIEEKIGEQIILNDDTYSIRHRIQG